MRDYINQFESTLSDESFNLRIRSQVLHDALIAVSRRTFNPYKNLIVSVICTHFYEIVRLISTTNIMLKLYL